MRKLIVVFAFILALLGSNLTYAEVQDDSIKSDDALKTFMSSKNSKLSDQALDNLMKSINKASANYNVDKELIAAVIWQESNFNPSLTYNRCIGAMQIHVNTGKAYGYTSEDLYNSDINIDFGTRYLSGHIQSYGGDVLKALSAYNQGTTRVNKGNYSTKYQSQVSAKMETIKTYVATYVASH